ncbi:MAG: ATP-binding cassette domain-containing protein [Terriglobia bacterium]
MREGWQAPVRHCGHGGSTPIDSGNFAIQTRGLRKVYDGKVAVRNLTLDVRRGEVFGFLGPNGAGKSTSIKMLLGLVAPTDGRAWVLGHPAGDVPARAKIGFLPEHFRFHEWLNAEELLRLHGRLYGMPAGPLRQRIPELLDLVGLTPHRKKRLSDYSKGMLQRAGLAQALLNHPDLIFLDEPTSGLDPVGRLLVRDVIRAERERGATVFLNSHLLSEVEVTCDRVAFLKRGEVLSVRNLGSLIESEIRVSVKAGGLSEAMMAGLNSHVSGAQLGEGQLTFRVASRSELPHIIRYLVEHGAQIFEVTPSQPSLEEIFLQIIGKDSIL